MSTIQSFPYTIWYNDNKVLNIYIEKYKQILHHLAQKHLDKDIAATPDILQFLSIGDIASNLLLLGKPEPWNGAEYAKKFLEKEWAEFKIGGLQNLSSVKWSKIPGTNILLTNNDYTPGGVARINHPSQKDGAQLTGFSSIEEKEWLNLYAQVFEKIREIHPWFYTELTSVLQKVVPIGISRDCHNSGSFSDCIGHIYMSYPIGNIEPVIAVLEAVIHEYNHNKLHIIMMSDPLILNSGEEIYYSPYRPDARHLYGIYAWLHALSAVLYVIFTWIQEGTLTSPSKDLILKSLLYFMKDEASVRVLEKYGKFSPLGQELLNEMKAVHKHTLGIIKELRYGHELLEAASRECRNHFLEAQKNNKKILY